MYAYFEATRLLTLAYTVIDSKEALKRILEPAKEMIEFSHEKMKRMSELVLKGKKTTGYWYENPKKLIKEIIEVNHFNLPEDVEYVSIEFKGRELFMEDSNE